MGTEFEQGDERLIVKAKQALDRQAADLDPTTVLRLQRARVAALEARSSSRWWMVWASGLAMAGIASLAFLLWTKQPMPEPHQAPLFEDIDLVLSAENVELAKDLDFYHWLADADQTG
jgi:hypothetical protein